MTGHNEKIKQYFDGLSLDYQKAYDLDEKDPIRTHIFNVRKKIVFELIGREGGRLLDIGCGPGVMTKELLGKNFLVYGTDISPAMIEKANEVAKGSPYKEKAFFKVCDIEHLGFEDSYFDVILCIGVIEYLEDYTNAVSSMAKILKQRGTAIISVPNRLSIFNIADDLLSRIAFRLIPKVFNGRKSMKRYGIETKKFIPSRFAKDLERHGLLKISMRFHGYRLASLRRVFPRLWIFLNDALDKINLPFLAPILAVNCVIKFEKR